MRGRGGQYGAADGDASADGDDCAQCDGQAHRHVSADSDANGHAHPANHHGDGETEG